MLQVTLKMALTCKMEQLINIFMKVIEANINNGIVNALIMVNMRFKDFYSLICLGIWKNSNLMDSDLMESLLCFIIIMVRY